MTCDEFRKTVEAGPPASVTRARRAAMAWHRDNCRACLKWLEEIIRTVPLAVSPAELAARVAEDEALADRDRQDPEYRAVAYGES